ncbi:MAG TPA: thioredoxin family protein [Aggregatilinea sp.]|jgi:glutaredoxin-like protein|uniref:protein disulfide oxidoreductase n=1 Tax=Aggregatilinea sp. TaxID=2806333 RepID=UPI002C02539E|nr:thioredoxin family protein [Aggregatilinea sp.]HML20860.1 thioredoxin family protein [Aggregatilinea sp.]
MDTDTQNQVRELLSTVSTPVTLHLFTQEFECGYCKETRQIAEEVSALSDLVTLEIHDLQADSELAASLNIDKIPAIAVFEGDKDFGIRFYGIPSGYEFTSFLEAILLVGAGSVELEKETLAFLEALDEPLHLQVFVTPTCPYCPRAVSLAHMLAYASPKITADMVEVTEFPHLGNRYHVMGVPRTVIGEEVYVEGAVPERMLLDKLKAAAQRS